MSEEEKKKLQEVVRLEEEIVESEKIAANYDYKLEGFQKSLDALKYGLPEILDLLEIEYNPNIENVDGSDQKVLDIDQKNLNTLVKYLSKVEEKSNTIIELYNLFQKRQVYLVIA